MLDGSRQRRSEVVEKADMLIVTDDPNTSVEAAEATFAWDSVNHHLYINSDGGTTWIMLI